MNEEDLKRYLSSIVENFNKANNCYIQLMTNDQINFLDELEVIIEKYNMGEIL